MANTIVALVIFIITFYFIISNKIDRTIASFVGAIIMVIAGSVMGFYSQEEAFHAIDFNMMGLLIGMMIIVAVCKRTGFFSYVAVKAAKASNGSPLRLMIMMGLITAFLSMILDNVTTIILVIPITVLICDILGINPLPIVMTEIVLSNIGGVGTMVGDPPNMMIASQANFTFNDFIVNLFPVVLVAMLLGLFVLIYLFRKDVFKKTKDFRPILNIDESAAIRDKGALRKVGLSLGIVFALFLAQESYGFDHALIAFIGAGIVVILVRPNIEEILQEIKWPIFVFFASLFVIVGGLESTGFFQLISERIVSLANINMNLAKVSVLWSSAILASLVDRIPFTTAMLPIIKNIGNLGLNVDPLWWILALGVGFGGNGTPIGSIVGVVGIAMSEKTRTPIDYKTWFKTATLVMFVTLLFVTAIIWIF